MNNKKHVLAGLLLAASIGVTGTAFASSGHDAHVHGAGALNVVVEGKDVAMELTLPGADVVGFEHKAENETDIKAVRDALDTLESAANIFALPAKAGCEVVEAHAESSLLEDKGNQVRTDEHKHENQSEPRHGDFAAVYAFECASPDALRDIEVKLFVLFPSLEEVMVQTVTAKGQWAKELTPSDNRFLLVF